MKRIIILTVLGIALSQLLAWSCIYEFHFQNIAITSVSLFALISVWALILSLDKSRPELFKLCRSCVFIGFLAGIIALAQVVFIDRLSEPKRPKSLYEDIDPEIRKRQNRVNELMLLGRKENLDSALILIDQILDLGGDQFHTSINRLMVLVSLKEYDEALEVNQELLDLTENAPMCLLQRGRIYELLNDSLNSREFFDRGLSELEKLMEEDQANWNLKLNYAEALNTSGNYQKGLEVLNELKRDYPEQEIIQVWELSEESVFIN